MVGARRGAVAVALFLAACSPAAEDAETLDDFCFYVDRAIRLADAPDSEVEAALSDVIAAGIGYGTRAGERWANAAVKRLAAALDAGHEVAALAVFDDLVVSCEPYFDRQLGV